MESINSTFFWWSTLLAIGFIGAYVLLILWSAWKGKGTNSTLRERLRLHALRNNLRTLKTTTNAEQRRWKAYR